jgi:hypothetical protein
MNENFILDSTRILFKALDLLLFNGSIIFPECILIFDLNILMKQCLKEKSEGSVKLVGCIGKPSKKGKFQKFFSPHPHLLLF